MIPSSLARSGNPEQHELTTQAPWLIQEDQSACEAGLGQMVSSGRVGTTNTTCLTAQAPK